MTLVLSFSFFAIDGGGGGAPRPLPRDVVRRSLTEIQRCPGIWTRDQRYKQSQTLRTKEDYLWHSRGSEPHNADNDRRRCKKNSLNPIDSQP